MKIPAGILGTLACGRSRFFSRRTKILWKQNGSQAHRSQLSWSTLQLSRFDFATLVYTNTWQFQRQPCLDLVLPGTTYRQYFDTSKYIVVLAIGYRFGNRVRCDTDNQNRKPIRFRYSIPTTRYPTWYQYILFFSTSGPLLSKNVLSSYDIVADTFSTTRNARMLVVSVPDILPSSCRIFVLFSCFCCFFSRKREKLRSKFLRNNGPQTVHALVRVLYTIIIHHKTHGYTRGWRAIRVRYDVSDVRYFDKSIMSKVIFRYRDFDISIRTMCIIVQSTGHLRYQ